MPELPEAETIVRGLRPAVVGRTIAEVIVVHDDVLPGTAHDFRIRVLGRTVSAVSRRGKNVVLELDDGCVVLVNLGMTGKLLPDPPDEGPGASTHPAVRFQLGDGELVYDDVRRFGRVEAMAAPTWDERSETLGVEPLDRTFTPDRLASLVARTRTPVRSFLLDQRRIAGVGNIYASEALFRSRIHPRRPARSLEPPEVEALHAAIRDVLQAAIEAGGTTIRDYRSASGEEGRYARELAVYGREGEPCPRCETPLRRLVFSNRSSFLCPRCQPFPGDEP